VPTAKQVGEHPLLPSDGPVSSRTQSATAVSDATESLFIIKYWANSVAHPVTGAEMEYQQLISNLATKEPWQLLAANKFGCFTQGVGGHIKGTDTIQWIPCANLLAYQQPTYPRFVWTIREQKEEKCCTRMTLGGNLVDYPDDVSVGMAEMETIKILLNSVVSTPGAAFCSANVTNFYLNTPMDWEECVCVHISLIPDEIIQEYRLHKLLDSKGHALGCVQKGMYSLPQASMLANKLLKKRLAPHGYHKCIHTPGLWKHAS
jgi:hypothetical protein